MDKDIKIEEMIEELKDNNEKVTFENMINLFENCYFDEFVNDGDAWDFISENWSYLYLIEDYTFSQIKESASEILRNQVYEEIQNMDFSEYEDEEDDE